MPRWTLAAAFALGLLPGLLLYWSVRPTNPPVTQPVTPAAPPVTPPPATPPATTEEQPAPNRPPRAPTAVFDAAELARMLGERSDQLKAAQNAQADFTRQLRELEAKVEIMIQEEAKRKISESELRDQLTTAQRETDAVKITAQTRDTALRELETKNAELRKQVADATQKNGRRKQAGAELEELGRRRESYLNNILGRYREATDLFRTMSLRLDNPRDAGSPLNNDLSRIQQAIQSADEDLRQLRVLNAQAARLQKDLN